MENTKLYHGTCMAFVQLAKEKKGKFGPDYDRISFTPNYPHAKMYAESWKTPAGRLRLEKYFWELPEEFHSPIILEFNSLQFRKLIKTMDGGAIEFYVPNGPIALPN